MKSTSSGFLHFFSTRMHTGMPVEFGRRRTFSMAAGKTLSWNGAPLRSAPGYMSRQAHTVVQRARWLMNHGRDELQKLETVALGSSFREGGSLCRPPQFVSLMPPSVLNCL